MELASNSVSITCAIKPHGSFHLFLKVQLTGKDGPVVGGSLMVRGRQGGQMRNASAAIHVRVEPKLRVDPPNIILQPDGPQHGSPARMTARIVQMKLVPDESDHAVATRCTEPSLAIKLSEWTAWTMAPGGRCVQREADLTVATGAETALDGNAFVAVALARDPKSEAPPTPIQWRRPQSFTVTPRALALSVSQPVGNLLVTTSRGLAIKATVDKPEWLVVEEAPNAARPEGEREVRLFRVTRSPSGGTDVVGVTRVRLAEAGAASLATVIDISLTP